ncbi:MAG: hypothetical protein WKG03_13500 [Telluria sp.]
MAEYEVGGRDQGPVDFQQEGTYRRGYHQAVAEIAYQMSIHKLTADDLEGWVEGAGMAWRKDVPLTRMIEPPPISGAATDDVA